MKTEIISKTEQAIQAVTTIENKIDWDNDDFSEESGREILKEVEKVIGVGFGYSNECLEDPFEVSKIIDEIKDLLKDVVYFANKTSEIKTINYGGGLPTVVKGAVFFGIDKDRIPSHYMADIFLKFAPEAIQYTSDNYHYFFHTEEDAKEAMWSWLHNNEIYRGGDCGITALDGKYYLDHTLSWEEGEDENGYQVVTQSSQEATLQDFIEALEVK